MIREIFSIPGKLFSPGEVEVSLNVSQQLIDQLWVFAIIFVVMPNLTAWIVLIMDYIKNRKKK